VTNKKCIDIYLKIHVSQIKSYDEDTKKAWKLGQRIYMGTNYDRNELMYDDIEDFESSIGHECSDVFKAGFGMARITMPNVDL